MTAAPTHPYVRVPGNNANARYLRRSPGPGAGEFVLPAPTGPYPVAGIDHPHEGAVVTLPGGRVVQCDGCDNALTAAEGVAIRARDMSFAGRT